MKLDIHGKSYEFLRKPDGYIDKYKQIKRLRGREGWRDLVPQTTRRQFRTAHEILSRLTGGQRGVVLADDVGLGKTTVAVLCALVFVGTGKRVRILAPNKMMARRWRQELEVQLEVVGAFKAHLDLAPARKRLGQNIQKLTSGAIAVSTHHMAGKIGCDLLIVDEAHRGRSDSSRLATALRTQDRSIGRLIVLTATPFSLDPSDLGKMIARIGGREAKKPIQTYARLLKELWNEPEMGDPQERADALVKAACEAVEAMRPWVIRHGIEDLPKSERKRFGELDYDGSATSTVPSWLVEVMLRADRALGLAQAAGVWRRRLRNDPRYHVSLGKLRDDMDALQKALKGVPRRKQRVLQERALDHVKHALKGLSVKARHPKIVGTVDLIRGAVLKEGEKVLVFCDHLIPAAELTAAIEKELRWTAKGRRGKRPRQQIWRKAWDSVLSRPYDEAYGESERRGDRKRYENYIAWLSSDGVSAQVADWLGDELNADVDSAGLASLIRKRRARGHPKCNYIGVHAFELFQQLVNPESRSTRTILLGSEKGATRLPGATRARVAAVCERYNSAGAGAGVFYNNQPDAVLAVFNSPFGPDVLVTTDCLSEGVDLHRFCRTLIHHELDPSPVRTVQRNGRLRRVNSWAGRTEQAIRIWTPCLLGTRDERLVDIMSYRLRQFDLLLGGVRVKIDIDEASDNSTLEPKRILGMAQARLRRKSMRLALPF